MKQLLFQILPIKPNILSCKCIFKSSRICWIYKVVESGANSFLLKNWYPQQVIPWLHLILPSIWPFYPNIFSFTTFSLAQYKLNLCLIEYMSTSSVPDCYNILLPQFINPVVSRIFSKLRKASVFEEQIIKAVFDSCRSNIKVRYYFIFVVADVRNMPLRNVLLYR